MLSPMAHTGGILTRPSGVGYGRGLTMGKASTLSMLPPWVDQLPRVPSGTDAGWTRLEKVRAHYRPTAHSPATKGIE